MKSPVFLSVEQVIAIHRRVVDEFGGAAEIRDRGLLESAVAVPAARFAGRWLHRRVSDMAAAYLFHLCRNHAFLDGNKRTALAAAEVFLLLNGRRLDATDDEVVELTLGVAEGTTSKEETVAFFRRQCVR